ncbi:MAG: ribonuclease Z [Bacteroidales bacterium]|jgi:ribonuclease Z|nr:ribonuclease Z [Bacteroidales bacterium]
MHDFKVRILGSSSALPTSTRMTTAQAVLYNEVPYLIDCGEGTQMQMRRYNVHFGRLKNIFISHLHGDHIYGIFGLLSSFNLLGRKQDLNIFAPEQLKKLYETVLDLNNDNLNYKINFYSLDCSGKSLIFSNKHLNVYSFPLKHSKPVFGFLFEEKPKQLNIRKEIISRYNLSIKQIIDIKNGNDFVLPDGRVILNTELTHSPIPPCSYAFCTDTLPIPNIKKYINNVNILYHEATFGSDMKEMAKTTMHSTASQAAEIAKKVNAGELVIGHFSSRYKNVDILLNEARDIFPDTVEAKDGLLIYIKSKN